MDTPANFPPPTAVTKSTYGAIVSDTTFPTRRADDAIACKAERVRADAFHDPADRDELTGVVTRLALRSYLRRTLSGALGRDGVLGLLVLDLDAFRLVNQQHGFAGGDDVLRAFAGRLCARVRRSDVVARLGGDEFAIVLTGLRSPQQAAVVANRIVKECAAPIVRGDAAIGVSVSIGIATAPHDAQDFDDLAVAAETAMRAAQASGGCGYRLSGGALERLARPDPGEQCELIRVQLGLLTPREREVLDQIVAGRSNKAIAARTGASPRTIETHRARIMRKMGAGSVVDLVHMVVAVSRA